MQLFFEHIGKTRVESIQNKRWIGKYYGRRTLNAAWPNIYILSSGSQGISEYGNGYIDGNRVQRNLVYNVGQFGRIFLTSIVVKMNDLMTYGLWRWQKYRHGWKTLHSHLG